MDLELGQVPAPAGPGRRRRISRTLASRIRETYRYDTRLWRTGIVGPWMVAVAAVAAVMLGAPTGLGKPTDLMLALGAGTFLLAVSGHLAAVLLALAGLRVPRLFTGCLLGSAGTVMVILCYSDVNADASAAVACSAAALGAIAGLAAGLLTTRRILPGLLLLAGLAALPFVAVGGLSLEHGGRSDDSAVSRPAEDGPAYGDSADTGSADTGPADTDSTHTGPADTYAADNDSANRDSPDDATVSPAAAPLDAPNPGMPGGHAYRSFTYASGSDRHRAEYGREAAVRSSSVDASSYIKKWPALRSLFWGFGPKSLPLNGRVWMPEGDGPFPLALIVHGNHMMEDYSDEGYAYIGELLASRGFIAVSLDENFLNYSAWSGIPDDDNKLRAWIILKHLEQLSAFSDARDNPFYGNIDFANTALIGHSRGGQAVAMAADAQRWFRGDSALAAAGRFHISAVAALAPTDQMVDGMQARLHDISYMTLQGARDGDVHDFYGDRQYIRSSYSADTDAFKTSLYIGDANHSQFNSDWGLYDLAPPAGLFLGRDDIMDGEEQRRIAKVYISAFLETALHGSGEYAALFRDYRRGLNWLPSSTAYFNRYQDGGYRAIADFDEDRDKTTTAGRDGAITSAGLRWTEEAAKDREGRGKGTYGVLLERGAENAGEAFYRIALHAGSAEDAKPLGAEGLSFSMANRKANPDTGPPPRVEVELTDRFGVKARLPLSVVMIPLPPPKTQFARTPWLETRIGGGKYGKPYEPVFQTYELSFDLFLEKSPSLDTGRLTRIAFYLTGDSDAVMLDDIGFYSGGESPSMQTALTRLSGLRLFGVSCGLQRGRRLDGIPNTQFSELAKSILILQRSQQGLVLNLADSSEFQLAVLHTMGCRGILHQHLNNFLQHERFPQSIIRP